MIIAQDVSKTFASPHDGPVLALAPASVEVGAGEVLCVSGDSGSGKSTLLGILGLLRTPDTGTVRLDGRDCTRMTARQRDLARRELIGLVPQHPRLFTELTGVQNVDLARSGAATSRSRALLSRVGLGERTDQPVNTLSGGEQQRLSLARAIVNSPRIILADEPTSGLDDRNADMVSQLLASLAAEGAAVVIASHDARVLRVATRTMSLSKAVPA